MRQEVSGYGPRPSIEDDWRWQEEASRRLVIAPKGWYERDEPEEEPPDDDDEPTAPPVTAEAQRPGLEVGRGRADAPDNAYSTGGAPSS